MLNQNFTLVRGNSLQFKLNILDSSDIPDNIYLQVKNKSSDTTSVIMLELDKGITKIEDENSYIVYIDGETTTALELLNYIYQISLLYDSDYETVVEGKLIITPEV